MKPDLLCCWPKHIDYPLFRYYIQKYRNNFNNIYIGLTKGLADRDLTDFIFNNVKARVIRLKEPLGSQDWRNEAIRELLLHSQSDKVLFFEQDFLINERILEFLSKCDKPFLGFREGERVHPSFALVQRKYIEQTSKDFSAYPDDGMDHFGKFFKELQELIDFRFLDEFAFNYQWDFFHMNGLTQNYMCVKEGQPLYRGDEFITYNHLIQSLPVAQNGDFMKLSKFIEERYGIGNVKFIERFFPNESEVNK